MARSRPRARPCGASSADEKHVSPVRTADSAHCARPYDGATTSGGQECARRHDRAASVRGCPSPSPTSAGSDSAGVAAWSISAGCEPAALRRLPRTTADEAVSPDGRLRDDYAPLTPALDRLVLPGLTGRAAAAIAAERDARGVTVGPWSDGRQTVRPFPLDPLPRIVPAREWAHVAAGVEQRHRALNAFLADAYRAAGRRRGDADRQPEFVRARVLPGWAVAHSPAAAPRRRRAGLAGPAAGDRGRGRRAAHAGRRVGRRRRPPADRRRAWATRWPTGTAPASALPELPRGAGVGPVARGHGAGRGPGQRGTAGLRHRADRRPDGGGERRAGSSTACWPTRSGVPLVRAGGPLAPAGRRDRGVRRLASGARSTSSTGASTTAARRLPDTDRAAAGPCCSPRRCAPGGSGWPTCPATGVADDVGDLRWVPAMIRFYLGRSRCWARCPPGCSPTPTSGRRCATGCTNWWSSRSRGTAAAARSSAGTARPRSSPR